jgi:hypothetical protein
MGLADWFRETFANDDPSLSFGALQEAYQNGLMAAQPRLALVRNAPSREEWAAWRDDPTTLFVMAAMRGVAEAQKRSWDSIAWHGGKADPIALTEFRTRADAYESIESATYENMCAWADVDPEPMEEA